MGPTSDITSALASRNTPGPLPGRALGQAPDDASVSGFDEEAWRQRCDQIASQAAKGCGLSDVLYVRRYSEAIDAAMVDVPAGKRVDALVIASENDYVPQIEREAYARQLAGAGVCQHGIDPDCCPAGCAG